MLKALEFLVFVLVSFVATAAGWWTADRKPPVVLERAVATGPVRPGGNLYVEWSVLRERSCASMRQDIIISAAGRRWIMAPVILLGPPGPVGRLDTFTTSTPVPSDIPPGSAGLRLTIAYECNPVHWIWPIRQTLPDVPFSVVEGRR